MLKRIFDLLASLGGTLILSPIFMAIAIWVKLDSPGPIFFRQTRIGKTGKEFKIYKFRTMVVNAERLGAQITVGKDKRITRSGEFLRKYKLDELPQLFNVIQGDMSLVGPRPEVPKYVALYNPQQRQVLKVSPGITDLASLEFRNENELLSRARDPEATYIDEIMPRKLALNMQYISQANISFDIMIIFKTLWSVLVK
ncbi:MAG: sugar transferase [Cyanobacteria bacterium P01_A01_bin.45]